MGLWSGCGAQEKRKLRVTSRLCSVEWMSSDLHRRLERKRSEDEVGLGVKSSILAEGL